MAEKISFFSEESGEVIADMWCGKSIQSPGVVALTKVNCGSVYIGRLVYIF